MTILWYENAARQTKRKTSVRSWQKRTYLHDSVDLVLHVNEHTAGVLWTGMVHRSDVDACPVHEECQDLSKLRFVVTCRLDFG